MRKTLKERFYEKFEIIPICGCWIWTAHTFGSNKYGGFSVQHVDRMAHRVSWEIHNGEIPFGLQVLHRCDTPLCVNPNHLFLGNHAENMRDRNEKGRQLKGERHPNHKITREDLENIKRQRAAGLSLSNIADLHGVTKQRIWQLLRGIGCKHL